MSVVGQTRDRTPGITELRPAIAEFYARSRAAELAFSPEQFLSLLNEVAGKHGAGSSLEHFCATLRVEDLVLARACAAGNERAWEIFMQRFREKLYDISRQITREDAAGRELADSVYADLFGTRTREGERVSKLSSYSGRGSLDGWLRTVLAQEYVNTYRKQRRLVSLEEETEQGGQFAAPAPEPSAGTEPDLSKAVDDALRGLDAQDRFVLASYFLDQRTLAEIARSVSVHESTISRKIERLMKDLRKQVLKNLGKLGFSRRQAEECLSADVRDIVVDLRASLAQEPGPGAFSGKGANVGEGNR